MYVRYIINIFFLPFYIKIITVPGAVVNLYVRYIIIEKFVKI